MAVINFEYNYLFLAEKHCASRVLRDILLTHPCSHNLASHHVTLDELIHWQDRPIPCQFPPFDEFTIFSTVRNPADILVTMHFAKSFQEYMRFVGCNPRGVFFQHTDDVDVILRYENLQDDLNIFLDGIGAPLLDIPRKEEYVTGGKNPWPAYYEKGDIDFIIEAFPEITRHGYANTIRQEWEQWQLQTANGILSS
jgi:hypothetical protein